jgi:hypothetical protein
MSPPGQNTKPPTPRSSQLLHKEQQLLQNYTTLTPEQKVVFP